MKRQFAGVAFVLLGVVGAVPAQEQTASIVGVVRDSGGGVIPGASVTAANTSGLALPTVTDESGRYWFPSLPPGRFELIAELTGFAPVRRQGLDNSFGC